MSNTRIRIYELAAELGVDNVKMLKVCQKSNVQVKSHFSMVGKKEADLLRAAVRGPAKKTKAGQKGTRKAPPKKPVPPKVEPPEAPVVEADGGEDDIILLEVEEPVATAVESEVLAPPVEAAAATATTASATVEPETAGAWTPGGHESPMVVAQVEQTPTVVAEVEETPMVVAEVEETPMAVAEVEETPMVVAEVEQTPTVLAEVEKAPAAMVEVGEARPRVAEVAAVQESCVVIEAPKDTASLPPVGEVDFPDLPEYSAPEQPEAVAEVQPAVEEQEEPVAAEGQDEVSAPDVADGEAPAEEASAPKSSAQGAVMRRLHGYLPTKSSIKRMPVRIYLVALVLIAAVLLSFFLFVQPKNRSMADTREQIRDRQTSLQLLEIEMAKLESSKTRVQRLEKAMALFEDRLPRQGEVDIILREVWVIADAAGLKTQRIKTQKPRAESAYKVLPIEMELRGPFHGLYSFLLSLERLPGIMNVESLKIKVPGGGEDGNSVEANLVLNVFCRG